jgi:hypothetical protein
MIRLLPKIETRCSNPLTYGFEIRALEAIRVIYSGGNR